MLRSILQPNQVKTLVSNTHYRTFTTTFLRSTQDTTTTSNTTENETTSETTDEATPVTEAEPVNLSRRRRRFHEWVRGAGSKYARPSEGTTNYLGGVTPFPNNPLFQPRPPLSDTKREEIYQLHASDPEAWTIRQLAVKFGYSLKRIEAILKLKSSEKNMEAQGIPLQHQFTKGMEQYMGAKQPATLLQEPLIDIFPNVSKPRFKVLEEDAKFTAKDAADVLNRKQYTLLEKQAIASEEAKFELSSQQQQQQDDSSTVDNKKHSKFVIVDTSSQ